MAGYYLPVCSSSRSDNSNADISNGDNGDNGDLVGDSVGIDNDGGGAINTRTASPCVDAGILIRIKPSVTFARFV